MSLLMTILCTEPELSSSDINRMENSLETREVVIRKEPAELFRILKFEGLADSGGSAKQFIDAGEVLVNGDVETRRRRKIVAGDQIEFAGHLLKVKLA